MNKNITLDFTAEKAVDGAIAGQPLAIMPAELAKKLLKDYAKKLVSASSSDIIKPLMEEIEIAYRHGTVNDAVLACAQFIQERTLIDNCAKENWDAFAVENLDAMKA
jgi:hypothetical protein